MAIKSKKAISKVSTEEIAITTQKTASGLKSSTPKAPQEPVKRKKSAVGKARAKLKRRKAEIAQDEQLFQELEAKVISTDEQEYTSEYMFVYRKLKRLVRKAEKQAMLSGKSQDYYAVCTLISQQREVIADLRAVSDLSGQVQMLLEAAVQPMVSSIGQVLVDSFYQQRRLLMETSREKETQFALKKLNEITGEVSKALQIYYEQAAQKVYEVLVGAPEQPKKKKRK